MYTRQAINQIVSSVSLRSAFAYCIDLQDEKWHEAEEYGNKLAERDYWIAREVMWTLFFEICRRRALINDWQSPQGLYWE